MVAGGINKKSSEKSLLLAEREGFERRSRHRRGREVAIGGSQLAEEVTPTTKFAMHPFGVSLILQHFVLFLFGGIFFVNTFTKSTVKQKIPATWSQAVLTKNKKKSSEKSLLLAEREGFEPPVQLPVHRISSAARSTTPASFQCVLRVQMYKFIF